jgi:hypothetical protein
MICDPTVDQGAFVQAAGGTTCGACRVCDDVGSCSADDPSCCPASDSVGYWGFCGHTADVLVPSGCEYTNNYSRQGFGSSSGWFETYGCNDGVWTLLDSNGGGGPCSTCAPSYTNTWTDTCGGLLADTQTCTDACRTQDAPNYDGYCGKGLAQYAAPDCVYTNTSHQEGFGSSSGGFSSYRCVGGAWVSDGGNGGGGPCAACTPLWRNTWSDTCGNKSAKVLECTDNCRTIDAAINPGQCGDGKYAILTNGCQYRKDSTTVTTTSSSGGYSIYECQAGTWVGIDGNGGGGPCLGCTPFYTDTWSDDCGGESNDYLECTVKP